jgi:hypothetical protein
MGIDLAMNEALDRLHAAVPLSTSRFEKHVRTALRSQKTQDLESKSYLLTDRYDQGPMLRKQGALVEAQTLRRQDGRPSIDIVRLGFKGTDDKMLNDDRKNTNLCFKPKSPSLHEIQWSTQVHQALCWTMTASFIPWTQFTPHHISQHRRASSGGSKSPPRTTRKRLPT